MFAPSTFLLLGTLLTYKDRAACACSRCVYAGGEREAVRRVHAVAAGRGGSQVPAAQRVRVVGEPQGAQHRVIGRPPPLLLAGDVIFPGNPEHVYMC